MNYYDESTKRRHKKIDVENIDIKEECGDKNCADGNTPGDINFKAEGCSGKKCKKDVVDFETESAKSKKKKTKKDCCGSDECTDTECKKNKKADIDFETESAKSKKGKKKKCTGDENCTCPDCKKKKAEDDSVDFETESCKTKKSKKDVDVDFETENFKDVLNKAKEVGGKLNKQAKTVGSKLAKDFNTKASDLSTKLKNKKEDIDFRPKKKDVDIDFDESKLSDDMIRKINAEKKKLTRQLQRDEYDKRQADLKDWIDPDSLTEWDKLEAISYMKKHPNADKEEADRFVRRKHEEGARKNFENQRISRSVDKIKEREKDDRKEYEANNRKKKAEEDAIVDDLVGKMKKELETKKAISNSSVGKAAKKIGTDMRNKKKDIDLALAPTKKQIVDAFDKGGDYIAAGANKLAKNTADVANVTLNRAKTAGGKLAKDFNTKAADLGTKLKNKKKDIDIMIKNSGKKKNQELEIDTENLNDTKKKKKAMFDQECGDTPIPKSSKFINEEDDADLGIDPADADINVDNISLEYMVTSLDNAELDALNTERQVMTAMAEELYKEYLMTDYNLSDDCYAEYATEDDSDEEVVQERFFGGTGKSAADLAKPVVKGAKRLNDIKHGVGRHGIIRNVIHRTKKDLHEGGTVYKLLTWPFLLLKNTVQTVYHKTKSFITYKGLLISVEVKINREIKKLRKNFRNLPKAALAGGIGYATTTLNSMAKGEGAQLDPLEFITHEGANLISELGHDTMLRALTNKLADAVENSPEKIRQVIAERNKGVKEKLTPSDGENASTVLSIKDNKITAEHLVNLVGINGMIDDIDRWSDICENVARDVSNGNDGNISGYLTQAKSIQDKYMDNDKVNYGIIYSKNSASVKISDFYAEFADKLVDKAKSLEKGLDKISGLENVIKDSEGQLSETTEKTLAELNVVMQHTCNAFMEIIGTLDDLGKYVANTMNQYLNCLTAANSIKANRNAKNDDEE